MKIATILLGLIAIFIHVQLGLRAIRDLSPTYDEPVHFTAGYIYLKTGDYRFNSYQHPAFGKMWQAIPLLFLNPFLPTHHPAWLQQRWSTREQYQFADKFLFRNRISGETMMKWAKMDLETEVEWLATFSQRPDADNY